MIPLVKDTLDKKDINRLVEWLQTHPHLTKGPVTVEYEEAWSEMLGCRYSVFVNSGSSANLAMLYSMIASGKISPGDKVVVPAVSWSTDLAPVVQLGLRPILCDCNMENLSIDIDHFLRIIEEEEPKVLLLVSVLGLVPDMHQIVNICSDRGVYLLEDSCESLGSSLGDKKLGTFGLMSSFSTYFGHHISTIEGGMVCTNDREIYNVLKAIRSHGWDRDLDEDYRLRLRDIYNVDDFESLYKFYYYGFNLRSTDLQAFLGLGQLDKLEEINTKRNENFQTYNSLINNSFWKPSAAHADEYISNFAYPVIHPKRSELVSALQKNNVAVRPLICGSLEKQPFWGRTNEKPILKNADMVDKFGFYLPNNHQILKEEIQFICDIINDVI